MQSKEQIDQGQDQTKGRYYGHYYSSYEANVYHEIRQEIFGEDLGQNAWSTIAEFTQFINWLQLKPGDHLLDIGSGTGGPTIYIAKTTGCDATGIDINQQGITNANALAAQHGLADRVKFEVHDANQPLPFPAAAFEAVVCLDALGHLQDHAAAFAEWARVLKPGGRLVFTAGIAAARSLSEQEIAMLSRVGGTRPTFAAPGETERLLAAAGLQVVTTHDTTDSWSSIASHWLTARAKRETALREIEDDRMVEGTKQVLQVYKNIASERRLTRFAYSVAKPE